MPPVGLEPTIPTSARPQTDAIDRAATGIGCVLKVLDTLKLALYLFMHPLNVFHFVVLTSSTNSQ